MSTSEPVRAVIFDMDGVLTDSEPLINAAAVAMFKEKGLVVQPDDFLPFVGTGENRYIGGVAEKHHFPIDIAEAKKRTYELYLDMVPTHLAAFPGAVTLVRRCRQAGLKVAVASSADLIKINANLRTIGAPPEEWDAIVTGEDVEHRKPAPDIFLAAAARLSLAPKQCVVVEDAVNGVQAAKAAGMRCVAVAQSFPADRLRQADVVLERIADVTLENLRGQRSEGTGEPPSSPPDASLGGQAPCSPSAGAGKPWGFWATLGFALIIGLAVVVVQTAVGLGLWWAGSVDLSKWSSPEVENSGLLLSCATLATTPVVLALTVLAVWLRKRLTVRDYLGLRPVAPGLVWRWSIGLLAFGLVSDLITTALGRPLVPEVIMISLRTAVWPSLWVVALAVAGPLEEEVVFRGFMFRGFAGTRLGRAGTILVTSLLWCLLHVQYDAYGIVTVFASGLLLGWARWQTGSLYTSLALHALMNLIAAIQAFAMAASRA